jgi:hypothetical protein
MKFYWFSAGGPMLIVRTGTKGRVQSVKFDLFLQKM